MWRGRRGGRKPRLRCYVRARVDALPPPPPAAYAAAPGDIYPRGAQEQELCERASHPDWVYLGALLALDAGAITYGSVGSIQDNSSIAVRFTAPVAVGLAWGAGIGGGWLALSHCDPHYVGEAPREGDVHADWPLALSLALLGGSTAPMINAILVGGLPRDWSDSERAMHVVAAGAAGFVGALVPYLLPPRSWSAAKELEHLRLGPTEHGGLTLGWSATF